MDFKKYEYLWWSKRDIRGMLRSESNEEWGIIRNVDVTPVTPGGWMVLGTLTIIILITALIEISKLVKSKPILQIILCPYIILIY